MPVIAGKKSFIAGKELSAAGKELGIAGTESLIALRKGLIDEPEASAAIAIFLVASRELEIAIPTVHNAVNL